METVTRAYESVSDTIRNAANAGEVISAIESWEKLRSGLHEWRSLALIRFHQDTGRKEYVADKDQCDEIWPKITELEVSIKNLLMASPHRSAIEEKFGETLFQMWECDAASFAPEIKDDLVRESQLDQEYTELRSRSKFEFDGKDLTLSELASYLEDPDREVRYAALSKRSAWFAENQDSFDRIYDDLVRLRHGMARKLGYENYVGLAYKLMHRIDYDETDVDVFRKQVLDHVVPLCRDIRERQRAALGVEKLMSWDEPVHDPRGNPAPKGGHDWMVERATEMFSRLGHGMDDFFESMKVSQLMDLKSRKGKAGGGFCDYLPRARMPFIFANFNGTKHDVTVFTHEMGHAFQVYCSRDQAISDYYWPSYEACEIHSMGLEYLTWPHMDQFFEEDADYFRRTHLSESMLFLPYGVAVDHFQHLVYKNPEATPEERNAMWQEMERMYLPTTDYGSLPHESSGRFWQKQIHIYGSPFYYIDYTLALTCALQFWEQADKDRDTALRSYAELCKRGGQFPFQRLAKSAGLISPFQPGCLNSVVDGARKFLDL